MSGRPTDQGDSAKPSFKTNVNRAKTKRWVEAKSYTYDGDDWGEADDYDEYDGYDESEQPSKPTGLRQQGQSTISPSSGPDQPQSNQGRPHGFEQGQAGMSRGQQDYRQGQQPAYPPTGQTLPRDIRNSFDYGEEKRTFSGPQVGGPSTVAPLQTAYGQRVASGPVHSQATAGGGGPPAHDLQQPRPFYQQPEQARSRPSLDSQGRPVIRPGQGPAPHGQGYSERTPQQTNEYRTASMTSTSSRDQQHRRDFSGPGMPQPPVPRGPYARKSSLSQVDSAADGPPTTAGPPLSIVPSSVEAQVMQRDQSSNSNNSGKTLPFIRPADIYKRMQEERERERQSQESTRPNVDTLMAEDRPPVAASAISTQPKPAWMSPDTEEDNLKAPSTHRNGAGSPKLPELSGFGEGFGDPFTTANAQPRALDVTSLREDGQKMASHGGIDHVSTNRPEGAVRSNLQQQSSLGIRTAVQKAFDDQIPPTPTSTAGSAVARSNSESTNAISPIISRNPSAANPETKTRPTEVMGRRVSAIVEEQSPATSKAIPGGSAEMPPNPDFAHQRDRSSPSPGRSPARAPAIQTGGGLHQPERAEFTRSTPTSATQGERAPLGTNEAVEGAAARAIGSPSTSNLKQTAYPPNSQENTAGADSPTKGRVRDLAERYESANNSRRGSQESLQNRHSNSASPTKRSPVLRPQSSGQQQLSRPQIPGGWESYASNLLPGSREQPASSLSEMRPTEADSEVLSSTIVEQPLDMQRRNEDLAGEPADIEPTTARRNLSTKTPASDALKDPFSAVAAAGSALAGALASAVGSRGGESGPHREATPGDFNSARGRSASLKNEHINPEVVRPPLPPPSDSASSILPTPAEMQSPQKADGEGHHPDYFPAINPLKSRPSDSLHTSTPPPRIHPQNYPQMSVENSPDDQESDRLRKEIVRELSPNADQFDTNQHERPSSPQRQDSGLSASQAGPLRPESTNLPAEYDSYWNESLSPDQAAHFRDERLPTDSRGLESPHNVASGGEAAKNTWTGEETRKSPPVGPIPAINFDSVPETDVAPAKDNSVASVEGGRLDKPHILEHRFSWEPVPETLTNNGHAPTGAVGQNAPEAAWRSVENEPPAQVSEQLDSATMDSSAAWNEKALPPVDQSNTATATLPHPQPVVAEKTESPVTKTDAPLPPLPPNASEVKILSFKEIVAIQPQDERIKAFNNTRKQLLELDSGLSNWLAVTTQSLPEHGDLLSNGARFGQPSGHRATPSKSRILGGRNASGAPTSQPHHQQYLDASKPGTGSSPGGVQGSGYSPGTKVSGQQAKERGKELLHSAGIFGGKATSATKGLFSKGRNKLKGGSDKARSLSRSRMSSTDPPSSSRISTADAPEKGDESKLPADSYSPSPSQERQSVGNQKTVSADATLSSNAGAATPTQEDFRQIPGDADRSGRGSDGQLPTPPAEEDLEPTTPTPQRGNLRVINSSDGRNTLRDPIRDLERTQAATTGRSVHDDLAQLSEDSDATFHTADGRFEDQLPGRNGQSGRGDDQPFSGEPNGEQVDNGVVAGTYTQGPDANQQGMNVSSTTVRPFSFVQYNTMPEHYRSDPDSHAEEKSGGVNVEVQGVKHPALRDDSDDSSHKPDPIHYGPEYDFMSDGYRSNTRPRKQSFSRQFASESQSGLESGRRSEEDRSRSANANQINSQDPYQNKPVPVADTITHSLPVRPSGGAPPQTTPQGRRRGRSTGLVRDEAPPVPAISPSNLPDNYFPQSTSPRVSAALPRRSDTEYQLSGVGPPQIPVESNRRRSRSRSLSGILKKTRSGPGNSKDARGDSAMLDSPGDPSTTSKPKKRLSLFRSLTGYSPQANASNATQEPMQARGARKAFTDLSQGHSQHHRSASDAYALQRAGASAEEPTSTKKKRFSSMGFFGRSTSKPQETPAPDALKNVQTPRTDRRRSNIISRSPQTPTSSGRIYTSRESPFPPRSTSRTPSSQVPPPSDYFVPRRSTDVQKRYSNSQTWEQPPMLSSEYSGQPALPQKQPQTRYHFGNEANAGRDRGEGNLRASQRTDSTYAVGNRPTTEGQRRADGNGSPYGPRGQPSGALNPYARPLMPPTESSYASTVDAPPPPPPKDQAFVRTKR